MIIRNVVDLPQPDEPSKTQNSPAGIVSDRSSTTGAAVIALGHVVELDHRGARRGSSGGQALQHEISGQRQKDRRQSAEQHQIERVLAEPLEHEGAEPAGADQRGDDGEPDRLHGDDAQPSEQYRQRERHFDLPEDLPRRQPHPARGVDDGAVDAGDARTTVLRTIGSSA